MFRNTKIKNYSTPYIITTTDIDPGDSITTILSPVLPSGKYKIALFAEYQFRSIRINNDPNSGNVHWNTFGNLVGNIFGVNGGVYADDIEITVRINKILEGETQSFELSLPYGSKNTYFKANTMNDFVFTHDADDTNEEIVKIEIQWAEKQNWINPQIVLQKIGELD